MRLLVWLMLIVSFAARGNARGLSDFKEICGANKPGITFQEIEEYFGVQGRWDSSSGTKGRSSLYYDTANAHIEFIGTGSKLSKVRQIEIRMDIQDSVRLRKPSPKLNFSIVSGGIQLGMLRNEFDEKTKLLYEQTDGYTVNDACNDGGSTDDEDFCFHSKKERLCDFYTMHAHFGTYRNSNESHLANLFITIRLGCWSS